MKLLKRASADSAAPLGAFDLDFGIVGGCWIEG